MAQIGLCDRRSVRTNQSSLFSTKLPSADASSAWFNSRLSHGVSVLVGWGGRRVGEDSAPSLWPPDWAKCRLLLSSDTWSVISTRSLHLKWVVFLRIKMPPRGGSHWGTEMKLQSILVVNNTVKKTDRYLWFCNLGIFKMSPGCVPVCNIRFQRQNRL